VDVSQLEPAERDPKKLRNTALILVAVIIGGGFAILWAYQNFGKRTSQSDRPSMEAKITDDCRMVTADAKVRDIQNLKGEVTLALIASSELAAQSQPTLAAVRAVMSHFKEAEQQPKILVFVLDGVEKSPEKMTNVLSELGSEPEVWRVAASADGKVSVRAFLKNRLRFGVYPEVQEGEFIYDSKLVLLDQHLHLRGIPGSNEGWDFERVVKMEQQYATALKEHADKDGLIPPPMTTGRLQDLLIQSIEYLYDHPDEKGQSS